MSYFQNYLGKYESPPQNQGSQRQVKSPRSKSIRPTVRVHSASQLKTAKKNEKTDGAQLDRAYLYTEYSTPSRASEEKKVGQQLMQLPGNGKVHVLEYTRADEEQPNSGERIKFHKSEKYLSETESLYRSNEDLRKEIIHQNKELMDSKSEKKMLKQEIFELGEELQRLYSRTDKSENSPEYVSLKRMVKEQQGIIEKSEEILEKERKKGMLQENEIKRQRDQIHELERENRSLREKLNREGERLVSKNIELEELMKNTTLKQMHRDQKIQMAKKLEQSEKANILLLDKLQKLEKFKEESPTRLELEKYMSKSREQYLQMLQDKNLEVDRLTTEIISLETNLKHKDEMIRGLQSKSIVNGEWQEIMTQKDKTIELQKIQIDKLQTEIDELTERLLSETHKIRYVTSESPPELYKPYVNRFYSTRILRNTEKVYTPDISDHIDVALAEELNRRVNPPLLVFERQSPGVYYYGLQKVFIILKLGNIFVKSNGRVLPLNEFLEHETPEVQSRELEQKSLRSSPILKQFYGIGSPCHV